MKFLPDTTDAEHGGEVPSMEMAVERAHGARYGFGMPNDLGS